MLRLCGLDSVQGDNHRGGLKALTLQVEKRMLATAPTRSNEYPRTSNALLTSLGSEGAAYLLSAGRRTHASVGQYLLAAEAESPNVYFPENGLVSVLWTGADGRIAETGIIGSDGAVGFVEALSQPASRTSYR